MERPAAAEPAQVLIVDDEPNVLKVLGALLEQHGYQTLRAGSGGEAYDLVRSNDPDLVITDLKMEGMDGIELLTRLRDRFPEIPVILISAHGTVEAAVEAMKRGAFDFLTKPFERDQVLGLIGKALGQAARSRREFQGPYAGQDRCGITGRSAAIEAVRRMVERVAPSPTTVLITGETGTGKELVAGAIHRLSPRRAAPLVKINCGAIPDNLVESELFGHERGAFTGADHARPGRFELADGGTLFLDEIGELPAAMQVKLLRVLQDRHVDPVGGTGPRPIDVRLVAATNVDLDAAVAGKKFRADLLYRIRVVEIRVPPLGERRDDIPLLVERFIDKHAERLDRPRPEVSPGALEALAARDWPGNVRELENAVERALLLARGPQLTPYDFGLDDADAATPGASAPAASDQAAAADPAGTDLKQAARAAAAGAERRMIRAALAATGGNVTRAAERLRLSRRGLQLKLKELGIRHRSDQR